MAKVINFPQIPSEKKIPRSKISNAEWVVVIVALFFLDGVQALLTALAVGVIADSVGDIFIGAGLLTYLWARGELSWSPTKNRIILVFLATFALEFIPILNVAPFWWGDGLYLWHESRKRNKQADSQSEKQKRIDQDIAAPEQKSKIIEFRQKQATNREGGEEQMREAA